MNWNPSWNLARLLLMLTCAAGTTMATAASLSPEMQSLCRQVVRRVLCDRHQLAQPFALPHRLARGQDLRADLVAHLGQRQGAGRVDLLA